MNYTWNGTAVKEKSVNIFDKTLNKGDFLKIINLHIQFFS